MTKLPEDLKLALDGLRLLKEKFLTPLAQLDHILRVCEDGFVLYSEAEEKVKEIQQTIIQKERQAFEKQERQEAQFNIRIKMLKEQLETLQAKYAAEEQMQEKKRAEIIKETDRIEAECEFKKHELNKLSKEIRDDMTRLEIVRERIRRTRAVEG